MTYIFLTCQGCFCQHIFPALTFWSHIWCSSAHVLSIMADSDIEDVIPTPFIQENWIGKGQKVPMPGKMPMGLANYFTTVKEVPENIKNIYYADIHLNVKNFLKIKLPACTYALPEILIEQFPQLFCFNILPSSSFLCVLSTAASLVGGGLEIS